jgi:hypothetical protein
MKSEAQNENKQTKHSRKEWLIEEGKEILFVVIYLFLTLSLLSTMKALILAQQGVNDFLHCYLFALVESLALAKIVVIAQKLPLMEKCSTKPLIYEVIYKSTVMSIIVATGGNIEERVFAHHHAVSTHPILLMITHQIVLMIIFVALFTVRGLNRELGDGVLKNLFFGQRPASAVSQTGNAP